MGCTVAWHGIGRGSRALSRIILSLASVFTIGAAACTATAPDQSETWGSDQASLSYTGGTATLLIRASGSCYGSYGEFDQQLPTGTFSIPGTFTQLIGAYPGKIEYPARFSGTVDGHQVSLTVTIATLQTTVGPLALARGVATAWPACAYP
jgi:hypothetical protein